MTTEDDDKTLWEVDDVSDAELIDLSALKRLINEHVKLALEEYHNGDLADIWISGAKLWASNVDWPWAHYDFRIEADLYDVLHEKLVETVDLDVSQHAGEPLGEHDAEALAEFEATLDCLERAVAEYRPVVEALRSRAKIKP